MNSRLDRGQRANASFRVLPDLLLRNCRDLPDTECLVDPVDRARIAEGAPQRLTWHQVGQRVDRMALCLVDHQIAKGDVIAILDPAPFKAQITQLQSQRDQAQAQLDGLLTGARPQEIAALQAAVDAAEAQYDQAKEQAARTRELTERGVTAKAKSSFANSIVTLP